MAWELEFSEGFDQYGTVGDMYWRWDWRYLSSTSANYARGSGAGFQISATTSGSGALKAIKKLKTTARAGIFGFAFYTDAYPTNNRSAPLQILADSIQLSLTLETNGKLSLYRGGYTGTLLDTSTTILTTGVWYYIELKFYIDSTAGAYELKINETTEFSASSVNTQDGTSNYFDRFGFANCYAVTQKYYVDDLYLLTDSAYTANGFLGDIKVNSVAPDADGSNADWTRSQGTTDYENIDEYGVATDSNYLYSSTASDRVSVNMTDFSTSLPVLGVAAYAYCSTGTGGGRNVKALCKSGATTVLSVAQRVSDYNPVNVGYLNDPNTGSSWTLSGVNAAEFGLELQ